jgi:hypothetical protein
MIKILRFANEKYPWFLAITMGFIAVSFIVGMGWCRRNGGRSPHLIG